MKVMNRLKRICPICWNNKTDCLIELQIADFDNVTLDRKVAVVACKKCGFVYNDMSATKTELEQFYRNETLYSSDVGVGSGGDSQWDLERYSGYLNLLSPVLRMRNGKLADIGCAKGGFLHFLSQNGFNNLYGVEINPKCVELAGQTSQVRVKTGSLYELPFDDQEMEVLTYCHVLEHNDDIFLTLKEGRRVLRENGLIFIEVPDAGRYDFDPVFDFYWLSIREHINHFNAFYLEILMQSMGFETVILKEMITATSDYSQYPSVCGVFRKSCHSKPLEPYGNDQLRNALDRYIRQERRRFEAHRCLINTLVENQRPVFIWGIGLEFFFMYGMTKLSKCNIRRLIDKNPSKQKQTVDGMPICDTNCLPDITSDGTIIITSALHKDNMTNYLRQIGFGGKIVTLTQG